MVNIGEGSIFEGNARVEIADGESANERQERKGQDTLDGRLDAVLLLFPPLFHVVPLVLHEVGIVVARVLNGHVVAITELAQRAAPGTRPGIHGLRGR